MFESHPYSKNSLVIDETCPMSPSQVPAGIEGITIDASRTDFQAKAQFDEIAEIFVALQKPELIKALTVDYDAKLTRLPKLDALLNLEYFFMAGRKVKAFDDLSQFKRLKKVFLVAYKKPTLKLHHGQALAYFRAIRGQLEVIDFDVRSILLQSTGKLKRFAPMTSAFVTLEGCHALDMNTLAHVKGMQDLRILGRKNLDSFSFIADCIDLETVSITATDLRQTDVGTLDQAPKLRKLFLGQCSKPLLRDISAAAPSILMSNGDLTLLAGDEKPYSVYCEA